MMISYCPVSLLADRAVDAAGMGLRNISQHTIHTSIIGDNPEKSLYTGPGHLFEVYR